MYETLTTAAIVQIFTDEVQPLGGRVTDTFHRPGSIVRPLRCCRTSARCGRGTSFKPAWRCGPPRKSSGCIPICSARSVATGPSWPTRSNRCTSNASARTLSKRAPRCSARRSSDARPKKFSPSRSAGSAPRPRPKRKSFLISCLTSRSSKTLRCVDSSTRSWLGFISGSDRNRFGLMNAVTSVARDTRDPDARWRLEELGGGIGARLRPRRPAPTPKRAPTLSQMSSQ